MQQYKQEYRDIKPKYVRLADNVQSVLNQIVYDNNISIFDIESRIKDEDSFLEKITRKKYQSPFEEIEDICGVRVICYYQEDIENICRIIGDEFDVISKENKKDELDDNQFGYSSYHYIIKLKKSWLVHPNARGLEDLKVEIQVRTMLMHTWAAISHKLLYKREEDIPSEFKRKLNRLSALIELADEQFDLIKNVKIEYKNKISSMENKFDSSGELNADSLLALVDYYFPNRTYDESDIPNLLSEIRNCNISLSDFEQRIKTCMPFLNDMEAEEFSQEELPGWHYSGVVRTILDLTCDGYFERRGFPEEIREVVDKYRVIYKNITKTSR